MALIWIVLLPFAGCLCPALMPSNARNAEAWLAGGIAFMLAGMGLSGLWFRRFA